MGISRSVGFALLAAACGVPTLCACSTSPTTGAVVTDFGSDSAATRFRQTGAHEMTLADFCKAPPKAATPAGAEAIRASCRPQVLALVGDAVVFDKGNGLYPVIFKQPVRNGDICPPGTPSQSLCGNFATGDRMHSSRIDAS